LAIEDQKVKAILSFLAKKKYSAGNEVKSIVFLHDVTHRKEMK